MRVRILMLLSLIMSLTVVSSSSQPVYFLDLEPGTYLVYNLTGVYNGLKRYEVVGKTEVDGRRCTLVKSFLYVKTENRLFREGASLNSTFCYDDRGRPILEEVFVPEQLNFSVREVRTEYWWDGWEVTKALIRIEYEVNGTVIKEYEVDSRRMVVKYEGREYPFSWENLTSVLPYTPSALMEPHIDLSMDFKLGMKKFISMGGDNATVEVVAVDEVQTPVGTFLCYRLVIKGFDRGIPYESTVFITKERPRITVFYVTESEGIKQSGFLMDTNLKRDEVNLYYGALIMLVVLGSIIGYKFVTSLKEEKKGEGQPSD